MSAPTRKSEHPLVRALSMPSRLEILQYDCSFKSELGIPNGQYDVDLVFPPGSGSQRLDRKKLYAASILVNHGSCPPLSSDHGSVVSSDDSPVPSRTTTQDHMPYMPLVNDSALSLPHIGNREGWLVTPEEGVQPIKRASSPESFGNDGITPEDSSDEGFEEPDGVIGLVLAAFRGEPELLPEVYDILNRESLAYREVAAGTKRKSAGGGSRNSPKAARNSAKKGRAAVEGDESFDDEGLTHAKEQASSKKKLRGQLKFSCAFHKMFPLVYCAHTSIGEGGYFYQSCTGPGWREIRHLLDHYEKKHGRSQCLTCLAIFADIQALTIHQEEGGCIRNLDRSNKEPIDPAVMRRIQRAYANSVAEAPWSREEIRWYRICFIFFPLSVPPKSPYFGQEAEIRLLRVVIDSLENRIQNTPQNRSSANLRSIIDIIQDACRRLGPTLEDHDLPHTLPIEAQEHTTAAPVNGSDPLGQQIGHSSSEFEHIDLAENSAIIDPVILSWENRVQIHDMPNEETAQHRHLSPDIGGGDETFSVTFRGADDMFEDSSWDDF